MAEPTTYRVALLTGKNSLGTRFSNGQMPTFEVLPTASVSDLLKKVKTEKVAAVLVDLEFEPSTLEQAVNTIQSIRAADSEAALVMLARPRRGVSARLKAAGADEVLPWTIETQELQSTLEHILSSHAAELHERHLQDELLSKYCFGELVGGSEPMRRVYQAISRVAASNTSVIIRGESGTGKELAARAILASSPRWDKPFVSVNCAAIPETLIEAELFGYEKGSFTGAFQAHAGHFESAHTGTIFLDEIGSLSLGLQGKLLRVLEDHSVQRIGGKKAQRVDFRLIVASNEDLEEMVRAGRFREDLFYRIHVVPIFLPPLRERTGDIPLLVDHFVRLYCSANKVPAKRVDTDVLEILEEYSWPGNVRELENMMQRLVLMAEGQLIAVRHLPQQLLYNSTARQGALLIPEDGIVFDEEIARIESAYLQAALDRTKGKKSTAAALLHISPQKMKYLCRKYQI